jgi:hypothetical protein
VKSAVGVFVRLRLRCGRACELVRLRAVARGTHHDSAPNTLACDEQSGVSHDLQPHRSDPESLRSRRPEKHLVEREREQAGYQLQSDE